MGETEDRFDIILGHDVTHRAEGEARLSMPVQPRHLNRSGVVHGGVLAALLDVLCFQAGTYAGSPIRHVSRKAVTQTLSICYLSPCGADQVLTGEGRVLKAGRRAFYASAILTDETGREIASAQGSFLYLDSDKPAAQA